MIFAFNFTCQRDSELVELMSQTLIKHAAGILANIQVNYTGGREYTEYRNGAGWTASMMKLSALAKMLDDFEIKDDDYILSVDSDVVFTSPEVFEEINTRAGIIGHKHQQPYKTEFGLWGHMSGALIFIRGDIAKKMAALSDDELGKIRSDFKKHVVVENEDVVLSYLAHYCGATDHALPGHLSSGNFEEEVQSGKLKSYYHLNYCPTEFLGVPVTGKWDIAKVLKQKGIEL